MIKKLMCCAACTLAAAFTALFASACSGGEEQGQSVVEYKDSFSATLCLKVTSSLPKVEKIIARFGGEVDPDGVDKNTFLLTAGRKTLQPQNVYLCDEDGNNTDRASEYIAFEVDYASTIDVMQIGVYTQWAKSYSVQLTLNGESEIEIGGRTYNKLSVSYNAINDWICPETDVYTKDSFVYQNGQSDITFQRALFTPEKAKNDGGKNPLIVWLHGLAEGGTDINIPLLCANTTALSSDKIQSYFTTEEQQGAYVAVIQTPTMWLDTTGDGDDGLNVYTGNGQTSYYTATLDAAIGDYLETNPDIDASRVYIAGCSNGGFMTLNMAEHYGKKYAAYVPICEAYMNGNVTDEILNKWTDLNIWFIQSDDDGTVDPYSYTIPTYYRLIEAGAENVNFSLLTGYGHGCWTAFLSDEVNMMFDVQKVREDYKNLSFDKHGSLPREDGYYVCHENCTQNAGSVFAWLAAKSA